MRCAGSSPAPGADMDISNLTKKELADLAKNIRDREYELVQKKFDDFYKTDDFQYLCWLNEQRWQEQNIEITVTVRALVSVNASDKKKIDTNIIASDKEDLIRKSKMIDALLQTTEAQAMQSKALDAERLFKEKKSEFIDKYDLDRMHAYCAIINEMNRRKK